MTAKEMEINFWSWIYMGIINELKAGMLILLNNISNYRLILVICQEKVVVITIIKEKRYYLTFIHAPAGGATQFRATLLP